MGFVRMVGRATRQAFAHVVDLTLEACVEASRSVIGTPGLEQGVEDHFRLAGMQHTPPTHDFSEHEDQR